MARTNDSTGRQIVVATIADRDSANSWHKLNGVIRVATPKRFARSGYRLRVRALGLGVDALNSALRATATRGRVTYLATNPWIGVFLRILTRRPIVVTGIYSEPGTRNWNLLSTLLRRASVITHSAIEAENWTTSGGSAAFVRYGNTFREYLDAHESRETPRVRIFVGGTSDRDAHAVDQLVDEVLESDKFVDVVIAMGGPAVERRTSTASVRWLGWVEQATFGQAMADCDLTYIPLLDRQRAAGQMILVGSLQVGTPVVLSGVQGLSGYIEGNFVRAVTPGGRILDELIELQADAPDRVRVRDYWDSAYSQTTYFEAVSNAIEALSR